MDDSTPCTHPAADAAPDLPSPGPLARREAAAAASRRYAAAVLDGFPIPRDVFVRGARDLLVRLAPTEHAFFAGDPAARVVRAFAAELGPPSRAWRVRDGYFDTPHHRLFRNGVSVRLREYLRPARAAGFEVICASWRGAGGLPVPGTRTNRVLVQTFEQISRGRAGMVVAQYALGGLVRVGGVEKTRTVFEMHPFVTAGDARGDLATGTTGLDARAGDRRVTDHGLRVLVDEMHEAPFRGRAVVEIEFDGARAEQAGRLLERLRPLMGEGTRPKERNKIAYLLGGATMT